MVAETKKSPTALLKMLQSSNSLFKEMTAAIEETKDTPSELVKLLQEIRLLTGEIKNTVTAAQESQSDMVQSANNTRDVLYELALASFILALSEERIISNTDADLMILQSIETIEKKKRDRYLIFDTNQLQCNVRQKFIRKGANHAKNPAIDNW